mmetsp:Transcript_9458/g.57726  ORF Transcript_9458/g.57726 Transcript_9458/m.57726 type:complete len:86 (+) Transcript_9458:2409-2666(+)
MYVDVVSQHWGLLLPTFYKAFIFYISYSIETDLLPNPHSRIASVFLVLIGCLSSSNLAILLQKHMKQATLPTSNDLFLTTLLSTF